MNIFTVAHQLCDETPVIDLIEHVRLATIMHVVDKILDGAEQLCLTGTFVSETML